MTLIQAVDRACQEPTLLDALEWIAVWECERAIVQAHEFKVTGIPTGARGAGWDTFFKLCFSEVMKEWDNKESAQKRQRV